MGSGAGRLRRLLNRWSAGSQELEAGELRDTAAKWGATAISDLVDRQSTTVCGEIRSVSLRPAVQVPALVVEIVDGSGTLDLIWLGRRLIVGVEPGVTVRAHGRVTFRRNGPVLFNPAYEIVPARG